MKTKFLYTAFIGLLASSGLSNAMDRLTITDGSAGSSAPSQMTTYRGGNSSSLVEGVEFTDFAQKNVNATLKLSETDYLRLEGTIKYMGQNFSIMTDFLSYLNNYKPGMGTLAPKQEITLSGQDTINMDNFQKLALEVLFNESPDNVAKVPQALSNFRRQYIQPFGSYSYSQNCLMFSLLYFFDQSPTEKVNVTPNTSLNNLTFNISKYISTQKGKDMNFAFKKSEVQNTSGLTYVAEDTISRYMNQGGSYDSSKGQYKFSIEKIADSQYHLNVELSTSKPYGYYGSGSEEYTLQKISKFLLEIQ